MHFYISILMTIYATSLVYKHFVLQHHRYEHTLITKTKLKIIKIYRIIHDIININYIIANFLLVL